jgi:hypothetical protein
MTASPGIRDPCGTRARWAQSLRPGTNDQIVWSRRMHLLAFIEAAASSHCLYWASLKVLPLSVATKTPARLETSFSSATALRRSSLRADRMRSLSVTTGGAVRSCSLTIS